MKDNPFISFGIEIPKKYHDSVLKYTRQKGQSSSPEFTPFQRQIDFWFAAFLIAVNKKLPPIKETETYYATNASVFNNDTDRIGLMQLSVLGLTKEFDKLADHRWVFNYCLGLANAGMPYLIEILKDPDERPLWSILDEFEDLSV